jgi:hypothetical protein
VALTNTSAGLTAAAAVASNNSNSNINSTMGSVNLSSNLVSSSGTLPSSNSGINNASSLDLSSASAAAAAASAANTPSSTSITNNTLSRIFAILIKLVRELLNYVDANLKRNNLNCSHREMLSVIEKISERLDAPWHWLVSIMDATEAQLRFGSALSSTQINELGTSGAQYLRHLEERALLTNYFNNSQMGELFLSFLSFVSFRIS